MLETSIPHDSELERRIIGAALVDRCVSPDAKTVSTSDFYLTQNRKSWGAICELDEEHQPIDIVEVSSRSGNPMSELIRISADIPANLECKQAVVKLRELATRRTLQKTFSELADKATRDGIESLLDYADGLIQTVRTEDAKQNGTSKSLIEVYESDVFPRLDKFVSGKYVKVPFGFGPLDDSTNGGASPGELVIFGAKPKSGKSGMLVQVARSQAEQKDPDSNEYKFGAYICSREMLNYENAFRVLAQTTTYTINHFRPGLYEQSADHMKYHARQYGNIPLFFDDKAKTVRDIRKEVTRLENEGHKISSVFVDYVQLVRTEKKYSNKADMYEDIIYDLKDLATDLEKVVYVAAQFNREGTTAERPTMSDFKGSSAIEMAGNLILFWTLKQEIDVIQKGRLGEFWIEAGRNVAYDKFDICFYGEKALFGFL